LNVGGFPYVCLAMLLLLVPDPWIDRLLARRRTRLAGFTIFYEPGCNFCQRVSLVLREFLLSPTSSVVSASADPQACRLLMENNSWVVRDGNGQFYLKWRAMDQLLRQNPLLAPAAWFFERGLMRKPMEKLYDLIGANRQRFARVTKIFLPIRSTAPIGRLGLALCGFLMGLAFLSNVFGLMGLSFPALRRFDQVTAAFQVKQRWEVFAPNPVHFQRDYRVIAHMADGSAVDVMTLLPTPVFRVDANLRVAFSIPRWTKYYTRFDEFSEEAWAGFGRYLCRQAQARMPASTVQGVEITLVTEPIEGTPPAVTPVQHRVLDCSSASI